MHSTTPRRVAELRSEAARHGRLVEAFLTLHRNGCMNAWERAHHHAEQAKQANARADRLIALALQPA